MSAASCGRLAGFSYIRANPIVAARRFSSAVHLPEVMIAGMGVGRCRCGLPSEPVEDRHVQVGDEDVDSMAGQDGLRLAPVQRDHVPVPRSPQVRGHQVENPGIVVHNQDPRHHTSIPREVEHRLRYSSRPVSGGVGISLVALGLDC